MIPTVIFQTWKSRVSLPRNFAYWRESFARHNKAYDLRLFDDSDNRRYVASFSPAFLSIYDRFPREIFRADAIRPFYMFYEGGFYADMDFECLKPLDKYLSCEQIVLGSMGTDPDFPHSIPNAMLASPPFEGFWLLYLSHIAEKHERSSHLKAEYVTGPVILKECVSEYLSNRFAAQARVRGFYDEFDIQVPFERVRFSDIRVLPGIEWYPLDWSDPIHLKFRDNLLQRDEILSMDDVATLFGRSHAVTYWTHSR